MNKKEPKKILLEDRIRFLKTQLSDLSRELENNPNILNVRLYVRNEIKYLLRAIKIIEEEMEKRKN